MALGIGANRQWDPFLDAWLAQVGDKWNTPAGRDVIFDVDWQGGAALSARWPDDSLKIFILPPDLETLAARLRSRATDPASVIDVRLSGAIEELKHYPEYQHLIVNDDFDRALSELAGIIRKELATATMSRP